MQGKRAWFLLAGLFVLAGLAYWFRLRPPAPAPVPAPVHVVVQHVAAQPLTPNQALAVFRGRYHLAPDRRFLQAISAVDSFAATAPSATATARYRDGTWMIYSGSVEVGQLPAYPDFGDALTLLRARAAARAAGIHLSRDPLPASLVGAVSGFDDTALLSALVALDKNYRPGAVPTADLTAAARALVRLAYLEDDKTGTADGVYAEAMAALVLAETAGRESMLKEESLLASAMGYSAYALQAAQSLSADDPWRLYLTRQDDELERIAGQSSASGEAVYFWLRHLADEDRKDDWANWYKVHYGQLPLSLYTLDTELLLQGQDPQKLGSRALAEIAVFGVHGATRADAKYEDLPAVPAKVLGDFDQGLASLHSEVTGPYLTLDTFGAFYRGFLYTAVYDWGIYLLDEWGRVDSAKDFYVRLGQAPGQAAHEIYQWYGDKLASEQNGIGAAALVNHIGMQQVLGAAVYADTVEDVFKRLYPGFPEVREGADQLAALYDTRPDLRYDYLNLLFYARDLPGVADIYASLLSQESDDDSYAKLSTYGYNDDIADMLRVANDPRLAVRLRRSALLWLPDRAQHAEAVDAAYNKLLQQYPDKGELYVDYLAFLQHRKGYEGMLRVARLWLASQPRDKSIFDYWRASDAAADAQLHLGQVKQAWSVIATSLFDGREPPAVPTADMATSGYGDALDEGVHIALTNGDVAMAQALAQQLAATYPDSLGSQTPLLWFYWKQGHDNLAAAAIAHWPHPISNWQWYRTLGETLDEALGAEPIRAGQALVAMRQAHVQTQGLYEMITSVDASGHSKTALALLGLMFPNGVGRVAELSWGYGIVKKENGITSAEGWLKQHLPSIPLDEQCMYYYADYHYELIWDLLPDTSAVGEPDEVWLWRAAAVAQGYKITPAQRQHLDAYLAQGGSRWYPTLGRYVLGEDDGKAILDRPIARRPLSEASYYLALHALATGHYREGAEWLNVDLDTGDTRNGELIWAQALLSIWAQEKQSPEVLAKKGKLFPSDMQNYYDDANDED
ncbi:MAG TPA: hypothetical protein VFK21_11495 [Gammaproteobacteria bacterium]|nr:hypothetical protein [Gammaproteobacteria bacterium]